MTPGSAEGAEGRTGEFRASGRPRTHGLRRPEAMACGHPPSPAASNGAGDGEMNLAADRLHPDFALQASSRSRRSALPGGGQGYGGPPKPRARAEAAGLRLLPRLPRSGDGRPLQRAGARHRHIHAVEARRAAQLLQPRCARRRPECVAQRLRRLVEERAPALHARLPVPVPVRRYRIHPPARRDGLFQRPGLHIAVRVTTSGTVGT